MFDASFQQAAAPGFATFESGLCVCGVTDPPQLASRQHGGALCIVPGEYDLYGEGMERKSEAFTHSWMVRGPLGAYDFSDVCAAVRGRSAAEAAAVIVAGGAE